MFMRIMCVNMVFFFYTMQIFHIMIMILMHRIQNHVKIAAIKSCLLYTGNLCTKPIYRDTCKYLLQYLRVSTQINQGSNQHVPADSCCTLQI